MSTQNQTAAKATKYHWIVGKQNIKQENKNNNKILYNRIESNRTDIFFQWKKKFKSFSFSILDIFKFYRSHYNWLLTVSYWLCMNFCSCMKTIHLFLFFSIQKWRRGWEKDFQSIHFGKEFNHFGSMVLNALLNHQMF